MRWAWLVCLAGVALAEERAIDTLPWNATLQEALDEAEDRGAPLAVYVYEACEEGDAPAAIGASEATQVLYKFSLYRLDVSKESDERKAFDQLWGAACDLERTPAIHLFGPDQQAGPAAAQWRGMADSFADTKALAETCQAVLAQLERAPIDAGFYRNARGAWKRASEALSAGDKKTAVQDLEIVVAIASNCGKDFRFTAEARKRYDELMAEGRASLDSLKKALAAKDWRTVWSLGRELAETYQFTVLGSEIGDVLGSIDGDPEASSAIAEIAAHEEKGKSEERLAEAAKHRVEALAALRTRLDATQAPDDRVTVVFWVPILDEMSAQGPKGVTIVRSNFVVAGFWIGDDRAVALLWDPAAGKVVEQDDAEAHAEPFVELTARDDVERKVFSLLREQARYEGRPVVPVSIQPGDHGKLNVTWYDGWDLRAGRWSAGYSAVDVLSGTVEDRGHGK